MDLKIFVEEAHDYSDQIIVMGDWNSRMKDVDLFFEPLGMEEAIREQHKSIPPVTCQKSHSEPIDRIYTSSTLVGIHGSYLAFGKLGGNHCGLLLDIPTDFIFGFTLSNLVPSSTHQLKLDNPAVVNKYNLMLWNIIMTQGLDKELKKLHAECTYPMTSAQQCKFEHIDKKLLEAQYKADKKCSHIYAGSVEWLPQVKQAYELVEFWSMAVEQFRGKLVNKQRIHRLGRRYTLIYPLDIKEAKEGLTNAHSF